MTALLALSLTAPTGAQSPDVDLHARGRALFVEHGCVHCHREAEASALTAQSPGGPDLRRAGERLRAPWIASWLLDPGVHRRGARMPRLFADDEAGRVAARDIAAYLVTLGEDGLDESTVNTDAERGAELFTVRGCIACHVGADADEPASGRHVLPALQRKTTPRALVRYLRDPLRVHPGGLMPDLALDNAEAEALAAYLCPNEENTAEQNTAEQNTAASAGAGEPQRGAAEVTARRCTACHQLPDDRAPSQLPAPALADLAANAGGGCVTRRAPGDRGTPQFAFAADDRRALTAFLAAPAAAPETPAAELRRRLAQLRCTACHEHDGTGGMPPAVRERYHERLRVDAADHADPPSLTGVGDRLRPSWIAALLQDRVRARPYMELRMPHYAPRLTDGLAALLAGTEEPTERRGDSLEDIEHGRRLAGTTGFSCITCHDHQGTHASGSRAPDLARAYQRLRPGWLERWVRNPQAANPTTRMPTYFAGGRSGVRDVLDGDANAQIQALIAFMAQGDRAATPPGLEPISDAVVTPAAAGRALVYRTILPDLPPRSLALGFVDGMSLAIDVATPRLGYVWQGGFLNMQRKWTGRGRGPCDLVGAVLLDGVDGPMLGRGGEAVVAEFAGYHLAADAVTLHFFVESEPVVVVIDTIRAATAHGVRFTMTTDADVELYLARRGAAGELLRRNGRAAVDVRGRDGATCWLIGLAAALVTTQPGDEDEATLGLNAASGSGTATLWFPTDRSPAAFEDLWRRSPR